MSEFLMPYLIGLFTVLTVLVIWFFSPFKISIGEIFNKEFVTQEDFDTWLLTKNIKLGTLSSCWICFSFWTSIFVSSILILLNNLPLTFIPLAALTYPSIAYLYKALVTKK